MRSRFAVRFPKSQRLAWVTVLGAALLALAAGCGGGDSDSSGGTGVSGGGTEGEVVRFGVIAPFTGSYAVYGEPEKASVEAAVNKVNADGGIKVGDTTYQLEAKFYDGGIDPSQAVTAARQAITEDQVTFLTVLLGSLVPAVQPVTGDDALVFAVANGNSFMGPDDPFTFRSFYDMPRSVEASLEYLKSSLGPEPRVAMVYNNNDEAKELASISTGLAEEIGYSASATYVSPEASDYTPALTNVLAEDPDVIDFGNDSPSQYATMVKQARQLGYKGTFLFPDTIVESLINETAGPDAAAGSITSPTFTNFSTPEGKEWAEYVEEKSGPLQGWSAASYDTVLLLKAAIEKAQSTDVAGVADALKEVSVTDGLLGKDVSFEQRASSNDGYTLVGIDYPIAELTPSGGLKIVDTFTE